VIPPGTDGEICLLSLSLVGCSAERPALFPEEPDSFDKSDYSPVAQDYLLGGTALATRSFPDADIWRSRFLMAASSPTLFSEAIRSFGLRSRAVDGITPVDISSEASQHGPSCGCEPHSAVPAKDAAVIRHPCRFFPRSAPLSPVDVCLELRV
jgi:hypothetical protein